MSNEQRIDDLETENRVRRFTMYVAVFGVAMLLLCVAVIGVGYISLNAELKHREQVADLRWCSLIKSSLEQKSYVKLPPKVEAHNRALVTKLGHDLRCLK